MRQVNPQYVIDPKPGDQMVCPGCGVTLYLDESNGWRNDSVGYGCNPPRTVHTDHIATVFSHTKSESGGCTQPDCDSDLAAHLDGSAGHPFTFAARI